MRSGGLTTRRPARPPRGAATTAGVINPGDSAGGPLFHQMVGDLAYANTADPPAVWAPWALMVAPAASTFPWMPVPGNHELEKGTTDIHGAHANRTLASR